jgi:hypothetical protein
MKFVESIRRMKIPRSLLWTALAAGLVACETTPLQNIPSSEYGVFTPAKPYERIMNNVRIKWEVREDVIHYCAGKSELSRDQSNLTPPLACAIWNVNRNECTVITGPLTSKVALGHEVRHCFEGHFHR